MVSGLLAGRTTELAAFDRLLDAHPGQLRVVAVSAGPGIGKTRLLAELRHRAEALGWRSLGGTAPETVPDNATFTGGRYAVFADALDLMATEHLTRAGLQDVRVRPLLAVAPSAVAGYALADILALLNLNTGDVPRCPHGIHSAVRAMLVEEATPRGLVVVLDDMHWADPESVELVGHLLRNPLPAPVVLALGYRPRQAPQQLAAAIDSAVDRGVAQIFDLAALSEAESQVLLGPDVPDAVARRWYGLTGGNPRYLGALALLGPGATADLSSVLGPELSALPDTTREIAHAAAVLGVEFDPTLLPEVAQRPADEIEPALADMRRRDVIQHADAPGWLRFRDTPLHSAVLADAGALWRRGAHARAAASLRARNVTVTAYADHVAASVTAGDEPAIRTLVRAAAASRWKAPADAARYYGAAIGALPEERPARGRRGRLLLAQGEALLRAGDARGARAALADAIASLPRAGHRVRRRAVLAASLAARLTGDYVEAAAMVQREIDRDREPVPALYVELAAAYLMAGRLSEARALAEKVADRRDTHDLGTRAVIAFVRAYDGAIAEAREMADAVGAVVDGLTDAELLAELDAVMWLGWTDDFLGRHDCALRRMCRALSLARSVGQLHPLAYLLYGYATTLVAQGQLPEAEKYLQATLDLGRGAGSDEIAMIASTLLCQVAIGRGDVDEALRLGREANGYAARSRGWFASTATATYGWARLVGGDPAAAVDTILSRAGGSDLQMLSGRSRAGWYDVLTRAALELGDEAGARQWAARAANAAVERPVPCESTGYAALATARVLLAVRDTTAATERARVAREAFRRAGRPLEEAEAGLLVGRAEALTGERRRAGDSLRGAARLFAECGAVAGRAEAVLQMRRLGLRVPGTGPVVLPATAPASTAQGGTNGGGHGGGSTETLSKRELEVARLVAAGQTNRQVATALFLSEKTVERHLSSIFTKLGVANRTAVGAALAPAAV